MTADSIKTITNEEYNDGNDPIKEYLHKDARVMCAKTAKICDFLNNKTAAIENIEGDIITFKDGRTTGIKSFNGNFTLSSAITIHKAQGRTYAGKKNHTRHRTNEDQL